MTARAGDGGSEDAATPLDALAAAAGLARHWRDVDGRVHRVADATLAAILEALGHETGSEAGRARSLAALREDERARPRLIVADAGRALRLPAGVRRVEWVGEGADAAPLAIADGCVTLPDRPGYHHVLLDGEAWPIALAPALCPAPQPRSAGARPWGVGVQIPALRGRAERAFGTFAELAEAVAALARHGADAAAINPVHALFPGHGSGYSPYSPSSRLFLNTAMGDPALAGLPALPPGEASPLIDWERALPLRLQQLRAVFAGLEPGRRAAIIAACERRGEGLLRHAVFDALDCRLRPSGAHGWRDWPAALRRPDSEAVRRFAAEQRDEVEFQLFLQWLAGEGLEAAGKAARQGGMAVGLVGDLAVGVDPAGSDCWAMGEAMLRGLTIGAPPDPLGPQGQNWSITSFAPAGLKASGYAPWIAMLRAGFSGCGALRIDHAFGLARLWVIPEGGGPGDGAYLSFPFDDLLRLATLEAHRAGAAVIAEDLGTAPDGFTAAVTARRMLGMQVLWFQRAADHGFIGAADYAANAVAMTGTHDTVTVAGWWKGRDIDWDDRLGRLAPGVDRAEALRIRDWDRGLLWATVGAGATRPGADEAAPVVDAAIAHIARTPAALVLVPLEDLAGLEERPNLPGTVSEHPNWRRRLPQGVDALLDDPVIERRCRILSRQDSD